MVWNALSGNKSTLIRILEQFGHNESINHELKPVFLLLLFMDMFHPILWQERPNACMQKEAVSYEHAYLTG